jgi:hypothetical protein
MKWFKRNDYSLYKAHLKWMKSNYKISSKSPPDDDDA